MHSKTPAEISKEIGIRCNTVSVYAVYGTIYAKRYTFERTTKSSANKSDIDILFEREWDKARFRINKHAKRG